MDREFVRKNASGVVPVAFGLKFLLSGLDARNGETSTAEWLPELTFGVLLILTVIVGFLMPWIGADPSETDEFTRGHWALLITFGVWIVIGVAYLLVSYSTIPAWSILVFGVGGAALVSNERRRTGGT